MPRGRRRSTLAQLELQLAAVDAQRHRIVADIKAAVDHLVGTAARGGRAVAQNVASTVEAARPRRRRRRISAAHRAKLRASMQARWAKAKKAGKTRL